MFVKICGITSIGDAMVAADAGAKGIGLNFVPSSPRKVDVELAAQIAAAVKPRKLWVVAVVADLEDDAAAAIVERVKPDLVQLHGSESPDDAARIGALVRKPIIKAVRLATRGDLDTALRYDGFVLVDAHVDGALGGTGQLANWDLAHELVVRRRRSTILAGGLKPENVVAAIRRVHPFGVDVASGVERAPGEKDAELVRRFCEAAHQ